MSIPDRRARQLVDPPAVPAPGAGAFGRLPDACKR